ncbi:MAG TPA: class I SAM-dependent methyltransferase [Kofleriaceae bacterium]|nr:class I SAM-dependent methyltransferase [Kofleriaceae bacterium]
MIASKRSRKPATTERPLLGPGAEMVENLLEYPAAVLRQAAEKRGLAVKARATREELANLLVRETIRRQADELYQQQDNTFLSVDSSYPFLMRLIREAKPRRVFDIGSGTGLVADRMRKILPPDGFYYGIDQVAAGVERAREKLHGDPRFQFEVGDAATVQVTPGNDLVLFCWVMNWLDTRSVDRIFQRLGKLPPETTLITCVAFLACVQEGAERVAGSKHYAIARDFLLGKPSEAETLWDLTRYRSYHGSLVENFDILEEHVRPGANIFWVAKPRSNKRTRSTKRRRGA